MSERKERCDKCKWWELRNAHADNTPYNDETEGNCRRYPPTFNLGVLQDFLEDLPKELCEPIEASDESYMWQHPAMRGCAFCGEFTPKDDTPRYQPSNTSLARLWGYTGENVRDVARMIERVKPLIGQYTFDEIFTMWKPRRGTKRLDRLRDVFDRLSEDE